MAHTLFITHWYPSQTDPVQGTFIHEHARAVSLYHKVSVIHIEGISQFSPFILREWDGEITVYHLRYPKTRIIKTGWLSRWIGTRRLFAEICAQIFPPDILHAHVYSSADLGFWLSFLHHLPVVLTEHASAYPRKLFNRAQTLRNWFYLNRMQVIMPVSEDLSRHIQQFGIRTRFQVIPNAVDTRLFYPKKEKPADGSRMILVVAMLYPIKQIDHMIIAFSRLLNSHRRLKLVIVGDGPERPALERQVAELGIEANVTFTGLKHKPEIAALMRQADVIALSSAWENQPVVLLEGMSSGLPVVAPRIGGIPEIVPPYCGQLYPPNNISKLTECLEDILENPNSYPAAQIADYARNHFSYEIVGQLISNVYQSLLRT